jgi:hypothetical protein
MFRSDRARKFYSQLKTQSKTLDYLKKNAYDKNKYEKIMSYFPSQTLINILLEFGFKEKTKSVYPDHWILLKDRGYYDPSSIKRIFWRGPNEVLFDYISIIINYSRRNIINRKDSFTETELISYLYFVMASPVYRIFYKQKRINPLKIDEYFLDKETHQERLNRIEQFYYNRRKNDFENFKREFNSVIVSKMK